MPSKLLAVSSILLGLAALAAARPAQALNGNDRVSFGHRVVVRSDETVGDVVCFLCSVEAHGKIEGDVVTFLGSVRSSEPIDGDVVAFAGNVMLDEHAYIGGDLVVFGGDLRKGADAAVAHDQVVLPAIILFIPFLVLGGIVWGISALLRRRVPTFYVPPAR